MLFCCLLHNSDESSLRSKALSTLRAPDHKQVSSHFPTSSSVCQRWRHSVVSVASSRGLEDLERWRLIDELGESSNMAQPSVSELRLCQTAEPACLPSHPLAFPGLGKSCQHWVDDVMARCCIQVCGELRSVQPGVKPSACNPRCASPKFQTVTVYWLKCT